MLVPTRPIALEQYFALALDDEVGNPLQTELVAGLVVVNPPPGGPHQVAVMEMAAALHRSLPIGLRVVTGAAWVVDESFPASVRVPDVLVITERQAREQRLEEPPVLAVEVVSRRSSEERDLGTKRREYAAAGCRHYWVLLPDRPELIRFALDETAGAYVEAGRATAARVVRVREPFPIALDLARVTV
jgi:Uma2 family endonuclease